MDTPGKTARKKRGTALADARLSWASFTQAALSGLSGSRPESALLGARRGWKCLPGSERTDTAARALLQGHRLRETKRRARVQSVSESSGPMWCMARPPGQCTASKAGVDPFLIPGHGELTGPGFPPGPAQGASPLSATGSRSRGPPERRGLPKAPSDAVLP